MVVVVVVVMVVERLGSDSKTKYAQKGGEDEGDRPRNRSVFLLSRSTAFWGASHMHTHPP